MYSTRDTTTATFSTNAFQSSAFWVLEMSGTNAHLYVIWSTPEFVILIYGRVQIIKCTKTTLAPPSDYEARGIAEGEYTILIIYVWSLTLFFPQLLSEIIFGTWMHETRHETRQLSRSERGPWWFDMALQYIHTKCELQPEDLAQGGKKNRRLLRLPEFLSRLSRKTWISWAWRVIIATHISKLGPT